MQHVLNLFAEIVGPKGMITDQDLIEPWLTDWRGRYHGQSPAILAPASTEQLSAIVKLAAEHGIALVPQGGNSGMVAGATPDDSGKQILLSTRRMNRIDPVETDGTVIAEAGAILEHLHEATARAGRRFPLTLGGKGSATIGGLISTNAGGTQVLRHGTMRALVAGIEAVLPDGSIFDGMAMLKKDNRGFDIKNLLIGAEGTIGIVTRARLYTVPALIDRCVIWAGVSSTHVAHDLLLYMQKEAGSALEGFEILPQAALDHVVNHIPGSRAPLSQPYPWHVLIELVQDDAGQPAPAETAAQLATGALEKGLIEDAVISANEAQAEAFWHIRDNIAPAERAEGPALQHDISVPVSAMAGFIEKESPEIEAKFPGTHIIAFGHMGDGNIHYHVKAPKGVEPDIWYREMSGPISSDVYDRVATYGGSISAEHGIGQAKLSELARLSDPARLFALRAIKLAFDPKNILNPGKLIPPV